MTIEKKLDHILKELHHRVSNVPAIVKKENKRDEHAVKQLVHEIKHSLSKLKHLRSFDSDVGRLDLLEEYTHLIEKRMKAHSEVQIGDLLENLSKWIDFVHEKYTHSRVA